MMGEYILKRNKRHTEEENEERWLITYADMITLLMVFFVVMYAIAEVKASKLNPISFALQRNFTTEPGIIPAGESEGKYTGVGIGEGRTSVSGNQAEPQARPGHTSAKKTEARRLSRRRASRAVESW